VSVDDDKVAKGVRYFTEYHNLLPNNRKNSEIYTNDEQFVEYVAFNDSSVDTNEVNTTNPTFNTDGHPKDYQQGKMKFTICIVKVKQ